MLKEDEVILKEPTKGLTPDLKDKEIFNVYLNKSGKERHAGYFIVKIKNIEDEGDLIMKPLYKEQFKLTKGKNMHIISFNPKQKIKIKGLATIATTKLFEFAEKEKVDFITLNSPKKPLHKFLETFEYKGKRFKQTFGNKYYRFDMHELIK